MTRKRSFRRRARRGNGSFQTQCGDICIVKINMSEYPYEDKIHSEDGVNYKTFFLQQDKSW
jgi:hypothetical protein